MLIQDQKNQQPFIRNSMDILYRAYYTPPFFKIQ